MTIETTRCCVALTVVLLAGCSGKSPEARSQAEANAKPEPSALNTPESEDAGAAEPAAAEAGADADSLGARFRDPPWFRKTMLEGAEVLSASRSEADEQGRFKSNILFALPKGTTTEQCADAVTEPVKSAVANLERTTADDGRITVAGSTERYRVSMVCGEAKGVMRAYVGYEWTS